MPSSWATAHRRCRSTPTTCPWLRSRLRCGASGRRSRRPRCRSSGWRATSTRRPARPGCRRAAPRGFDAVEERAGARRGSTGRSAGIDAAFEQLDPPAAARCRPERFVFVCSDFLAAPPPRDLLRALGPPLGRRARRRPGSGLGAELSAPSTGSSSRSPIPRPAACSARTGAREGRRLRRREATRLASRALLDEFRSLGSTSSSIGDRRRRDHPAAFTDWAEARIANRRVSGGEAGLGRRRGCGRRSRRPARPRARLVAGLRAPAARAAVLRRTRRSRPARSRSATRSARDSTCCSTRAAIDVDSVRVRVALRPLARCRLRDPEDVKETACSSPTATSSTASNRAACRRAPHRRSSSSPPSSPSARATAGRGSPRSSWPDLSRLLLARRDRERDTPAQHLRYDGA